MKAILLDEAKKWLEENCENLYTRMAVFGLMQSMPTVDYQEEPNEPLTLEQLRASPHGKIKDSTLQSICNRANEIASRPPEGEEDT